MAYHVMIIRHNTTHEFICETMLPGAVEGTLAFGDVRDPDGTKYNKVVFLAPGDTLNFREIKE